MADEEVYADGYVRVPAKRWYHIADALTRRDELMEAVLKVLGDCGLKAERERRYGMEGVEMSTITVIAHKAKN